jgi:hypothetical protein
MWRLLFFFFPVLALAAQLRVEVRNSEAWLIRDGREIQLTHDGKSKRQAELSPSRKRIAYFDECVEAEHCTPTIIILDLEGHRLLSFQPKLEAEPPPGPCLSINSIAWVGNDVIASDCHLTPSSSEYVETELSTGRTIRDLFGLDFTKSPDGKDVAHAGWIVHFAPPDEQSYYLQIDHTTIYPLPKGTGPVEQVGLAQPPNVVQQHGLTYSGIHEFMPGLFWSPDSQHIALVDCTYVWTAHSPESQSEADGTETIPQCALAIVSRKGEAALFPLPGTSEADLQDISVTWTSPRRLALTARGISKTFSVP